MKRKAVDDNLGADQRSLDAWFKHNPALVKHNLDGVEDNIKQEDVPIINALGIAPLVPDELLEIVKVENSVIKVEICDPLQQIHSVGALTVSPESHVNVTHVIAIERFSSYDSSVPRQRVAHTSSANRIDYYLRTIHCTDNCTCHPATSSVLFNGVKSNMDISANNYKGVNELRQFLRGAIGSQGKVLIIVPSEDGFTTNIHGFINFFTEFKDLNLSLVVCKDSNSRSSTAHYQISKLVTVMEDVTAKRRGLASPTSAEEIFVDMMIKAGLSKFVMSLGHTSNLSIGIGNGRNTFKSTAPTQPHIVLAAEAGLPKDAVLRLVIRTQATKQNKGNRSIPEYSAVREESTSQLMCAVSGCSQQFSSIEKLVFHLVEVSMSSGTHPTPCSDERKCHCVLCGKTFADTRKQAYEDHLNRHFPDRFPCSGQCGTLDCLWVGSSDRDVCYHKSMMKPKYACPSCNRKYGTKGLLDQHIETAHIRRHQVVGLAAGIGYDVGVLGNGLLPWMRGAKDENDDIPTEMKLALEAAHAVIGARKRKV